MGQQDRDANSAIKELNQAINALGAAHQIVELHQLAPGDTFNGEEQVAPSMVVRFFPRFDGTANYEAITDALIPTI